MTASIQALPLALVNQIAAGEVIERPASVVKELLENAMDAKATSIRVDLSYGGLNAISVSDNGMGIAPDELQLAVAPHATSKIRQLDDLNTIATMGFRGEALASIASVSHFKIQSKAQNTDTPMQLAFEADEPRLSVCGREQGTTVEVNDLFYNTPVRKRFLGSEKTEFLAVDRLVRCFALSAPQIRLDFYHQGAPVFQLPAAKTEVLNRQRLQKLLGKGFVDAMSAMNESHAKLKISGWIAKPSFSRSQQDRMWVYVNQRMVNDKLLNHAIRQAYATLLPPGRFPACVVYIEIDPSEVDVNVHPTKHELRFHQPRWIHDALTQAVNAVLSQSETQAQALPQYEGMKERRSAAAASLGPSQSHWDWFNVNSAFAVLRNKNESFLLNANRFYAAYLKAQLKTATLPLASRPLFVPVQISIERHLPTLEIVIETLGHLGLNLSWLGGEQLIVRAVPVMMPHLDLHRWLRHVLATPLKKAEDYLQEMTQFQSFSLALLTDEEKQTWAAYLEVTNQEGACAYLQPLSIQNCTVLFDE